MNLQTSLRIGLLLLWSSLLTPSYVLADAVPAPPRSCPPGLMGITSHRGPECVAPPPKDCPPGWRGEIRGICRLETCQTDPECGDGKLCKEVDLCLKEFVEEWGWSQNEESRTRPLFAGPPMRFDPPRRTIRPIDICGADKRCEQEAKCGKGKLCLPKGVTRPGAYTPAAGVGKNAHKPAQ